MKFRWWYLIFIIPIVIVIIWVIYRSIQMTSWKCISAISFPVKRNFWGDIQCMSNDGKNCLYQCPDLRTSSPDIPMTCGPDHKRLYGITGYDTKGHWCQLADSTL